jgi:hypothetical protein
MLIMAQRLSGPDDGLPQSAVTADCMGCVVVFCCMLDTQWILWILVEIFLWLQLGHCELHLQWHNFMHMALSSAQAGAVVSGQDGNMA